MLIVTHYVTMKADVPNLLVHMGFEAVDRMGGAILDGVRHASSLVISVWARVR